MPLTAFPAVAIVDSTQTGRDLITAIDAAAGADVLGLGTTDSVSFQGLTVDTQDVNTAPIQTLANTAGQIQWFRTDADPEGVVTASIGDLAIDGTGGAAYIKATGTATNTGWAGLGGGGLIEPVTFTQTTKYDVGADSEMYNLDVDGLNYERCALQWNANVFELGPESAGTGVPRSVRILGPQIFMPDNVELPGGSRFDSTGVTRWFSPNGMVIQSNTGNIDFGQTNFNMRITVAAGVEMQNEQSPDTNPTLNLEFRGGQLAPLLQFTKGPEDSGFINFEGTLGGTAASDTVSVSTLTTSGAITNHIQVQINGTKAWIAVSTNPPT